ncbi:hypothetical protein V494_04758 [Pseudogymnoascus sp. VKM F-4513 (FW-928)]|nr:hypothetical protein V494_04758 [Pseudogymnoascus sp. VKM F-4513 (FW-928)]
MMLVACIKCGSPSPTVLDTRGEYYDMITEMLDSVAPTLPEPKGTDISYLAYDATKGELPQWELVDNFDAVIVTGSGLYKDKPRIRLFGSCFGHQIICHALFKASEEEDFPHGGRLSPPNPNPVVSRNPKGWEIGVHAINLSAKFMARFGAVSSNPVAPSQMRLRLIHRDHVNPHSLPDDFVNVGRSDLCETQGVYKRGRVLTFQGHPEFDDAIIADFGRPILGDRAMDTLRTGPDDSQYAARVILEFLREEVAEEEVTEGGAADGVPGGGVNEKVADSGLKGEVTEDNAMEKLISLFEKLAL